MKMNSMKSVAHTFISAVTGLLGLGMPGADWSDAPDDVSLDDIFGSSPDGSTTTVSEPDPTSTQTTTDEPFLKAKTGTVYKTKEEAELGIERKDQLITQLREQVQRATGQDPLRPVREEPRPVNYAENHEQYLRDVNDAVARKDTAAYMEAQKKFVYDTMAPIAPALINLNKANAERVLAEKYPDFKGFRNSEIYRDLEETSPLLAQAIRTAEDNPAAAAQLPELYEIAYLTSQGRRVPEIVRSVHPQTPTSPRPTVHSSPVSAPAVTGQPVASPSLDTREGRKALIAQQEAAGVLNQKW
jgi:hypothetical protein